LIYINREIWEYCNCVVKSRELGVVLVRHGEDLPLDILDVGEDPVLPDDDLDLSALKRQ
jgi:hypothetical protein